MDYTSEIAELLSRHRFRRFIMSRTQVGHLKLAGHIDGVESTSYSTPGRSRPSLN
jgi:hypothetical protein